MIAPTTPIGRRTTRPIAFWAGQRDVLARQRAAGDEPGVDLDVVGEALGLDARVADRLALLAGEQRGDLVEVRAHVGAGPHQDLGALVRRGLAPRGERPLPPRRWRGACRSASALGTCRRLARGGIADVGRRAAGGGNPLAIDQHLGHIGGTGDVTVEP